MKSVIFCLLILLTICIAARAQNGGQLHTNQFVSMTNFGHNGDYFSLKIDNKQPCEVTMKLTFKGMSMEFPVAASTFKMVRLYAPLDCSVRIQCKPLTRCADGPDMGQVEAKCNEGPDIIPLPIKFTNFIIRKKGGVK